MNDYILKIYQQLTGHTINEALFAFEQLDINDARSGDLYFGTYGVPNIIEISSAPYERFVCYEFLMQQLRKNDKDKFSQIHKGTPYYFLAWTAFEIRNFGKSVYYMDLALGEDIRKSTSSRRSLEDVARDALNNPGGGLWKLIPDGPAARVIQQIKVLIERTLNDFRIRTTEEIKLDEFVNQFVIETITRDVKSRSLISSLYSYIMEFNDLHETLKIRSQNLSSVEPLLANLFKGGLIFETLLKAISEQKSWLISRGPRSGRSPTTLGDFRRCDDFLTLFGIEEGDFTTRTSDLRLIIQSATDNSIGTSFSVTGKIRNTAGHDLRRDDVFQNPDDYKSLVDKELNAIFYLIKRIIS